MKSFQQFHPARHVVCSAGVRQDIGRERHPHFAQSSSLLLGLAVALSCGVVAAQTPQAEKKPAKQVSQREQPAAAAQLNKKKASAKPGWKPLFDGKTLKDWKITNFGGEGEVVVEKGVIVMGMGSSMTGITYIGKIPKCDYEIRLEAKRIDGIDFFATTTFPVNDSFCSLVVGGWAGPVVGISCIDFADASENETTTYQRFKEGRWYRIRVQVRANHIGAWIDDKQVVNLHIKGRKLATRAEVALSEPLGISCWETEAGIRKIELRPLPPEPKKK